MADNVFSVSFTLFNSNSTTSNAWHVNITNKYCSHCNQFQQHIIEEAFIGITDKAKLSFHKIEHPPKGLLY